MSRPAWLRQNLLKSLANSLPPEFENRNQFYLLDNLMKQSVRFTLVMSFVCIGIFVGAFFGGIALHSYLFERGSGLKYGNNQDLGLLILNDPKDEVAEEAEEIPEKMVEVVAAEPEKVEEEIVPAEEPEVEEETVAEENGEEIAIERRVSAGDIPPGLDNSPSDAREDALSDERFLTQTSDFFATDDSSGDGDSNSSASQDTISAVSNNTPPAEIPSPPPAETPEPPTPPVDIPAPGGSGNTIADVDISVGESGPRVAVGAGLTEEGVQADVSLDLISGGETEDGNSNESQELLSVSIGDGDEATAAQEDASSQTRQEVTTSQQPSLVQRQTNDGRVVIGQNNLYSNALAGSVSGLIGGMGAPTSSERVQYRGANPELSLPGVDADVSVTAPSTIVTSVNQTTNAAVNTVTSNAAVQQVARTVPIINAGGGNGGGITATVPTGIIDASVGGGNGVNVNVNADRLNLPATNILPNQIGIGVGGINIRANLSGR